jgi:type II secretory pathway pseudopilin PulG
MIVVLVCLIVLAMMGGVLLRRGQAQRGQVEAEERRLQAEWLAEAGLERASARLAESPEYNGEIWELSPQDLSGRWPAQVLIEVSKVAGNPGRRQVRVRADYPLQESLRARQSKQTIVELDSSRVGEKS